MGLWICNIEGGVNLFSIPLLFYPYILRAYRLYVVFEVNVRDARLARERREAELDVNSLNRVKEQRLLLVGLF